MGDETWNMTGTAEPGRADIEELKWPPRRATPLWVYLPEVGAAHSAEVLGMQGPSLQISEPTPSIAASSRRSGQHQTPTC